MLSLLCPNGADLLEEMPLQPSYKNGHQSTSGNGNGQIPPLQIGYLEKLGPFIIDNVPGSDIGVSLQFRILHDHMETFGLPAITIFGPCTMHGTLNMLPAPGQMVFDVPIHLLPDAMSTVLVMNMTRLLMSMFHVVWFQLEKPSLDSES